MTPVEAWRRSSYCGSTTCVEVRRDGSTYLVRDSKHPERPPLRFDQTSWEAFLGRIRAGDYAVM